MQMTQYKMWYPGETARKFSVDTKQFSLKRELASD